MNPYYILLAIVGAWFIYIAIRENVRYYKYQDVEYEVPALPAPLRSARRITYEPAPSNYEGVPPEGLTWEEVMLMRDEKPRTTSDGTIVLYTRRKLCPECGKDLMDYWSDYDEGMGQHNVAGEYCPDGHYTHLDFA